MIAREATMRFAIALLTFALAAAISGGAGAASVYTKIDDAACKVIET